MHVISRRKNEGIVVGDGIEIRVLKIYKTHVRIQISTPKTAQEESRCWEQDVQLSSPQQNDPSQNNTQWWNDAFRGNNRFDQLRS